MRVVVRLAPATSARSSSDVSLTADHFEGTRARARVFSRALTALVTVLCAGAVLAGCGLRSGGGAEPDGSATSSEPTRAAEPSADRSTDLSSLPPLVADASWVSRDTERALKVSPTDYLRDHPSRDVADEAWRRVVKAVPEADAPGMQDQFVCHAQFASAKSAWYLEPRRPAVGYANTVLAGCNPGDVTDVG